MRGEQILEGGEFGYVEQVNNAQRYKNVDRVKGKQRTGIL